MFFTYPLFLLGILAAGIPLVFHLLDRRKAPETPFPSLKFLKESIEQNARRRRIQDIILLAMRMAAIILLATALAEPRFGGGDTGGEDEGFATVIVLEDRLAEDDRIQLPKGVFGTEEPLTRFTAAVKAARGIIARFRKGRCRVAVVTTGHGVRGGGWSDDPVRAAEILKHIEPDGCEPDAAGAAARAIALLEEADEPTREIVWIGPATTLRSVPQNSPPKGVGITWVNTRTLPKPDDCALRFISAKPKSMLEGSDWEVIFDVLNRAGHERKSMLTVMPEMSATAGEFRNDSTEKKESETGSAGKEGAEESAAVFSPFSVPVTVAGGGVRRVSVTLPAALLSAAIKLTDDSRALPCRARLSNDDNLDNNGTCFVLHSARRRKALIVESEPEMSGDRATGFYVAAALDWDTVLAGLKDTSPDSRAPVEIHRRVPKQITRDDISASDAVFWTSREVPSQEILAALRTFLKDGGCLAVFPPKSDADIERFNAVFGTASTGALLPGRYFSRQGVPVRPENPPKLVSSPNPPEWWPAGVSPKDAAIRRDLFEGAAAWNTVPIVLRQSGDATGLLFCDREVVAGGAGGRTMAASVEIGGGLVVQFGLDAMGKWSSLPASRAWPPLLHSIATMRKAAKEWVSCGRLRAVEKQMSGGLVPQPFAAAGINRKRDSLKSLGGGITEAFDSRPGFVAWRHASGGKSPAALTALVPHPESLGTPRPAPVQRVREVFTQWAGGDSRFAEIPLADMKRTTPGAAAFDVEFSRLRGGFSLKNGLLAAVVAVLLVELWLGSKLAATGGGK